MQRMIQTGAPTMTSLQDLLELQPDWARQDTDALTMSIGRRSSGAYGHADEADQAAVRGIHSGAVRHLLAPSDSTEPPEHERIKP